MKWCRFDSGRSNHLRESLHDTFLRMILISHGYHMENHHSNVTARTYESVTDAADLARRTTLVGPPIILRATAHSHTLVDQ